MGQSGCLAIPWRVISLSQRWVSEILLLAGLVLCLGAAYGLTQAVCVTDGCRMYAGYSFLGLSFHLWGAAAFGAGLVLRAYAYHAYRGYLMACLWAEIGLLAWQIVFLPCSECLLVGLIWGALAWLEYRSRAPVKIWSVVFLTALALLGKEVLSPWAVYGSPEAKIKVYFSPSCPGCRDEIEKLLASGLAQEVALYPVVLKDSDCRQVSVLKSYLDRRVDLAQALKACWSGEGLEGWSLGWLDCFRVKFGLYRNRVQLARLGVERVPFMMGSATSWLFGGRTESDRECGLGQEEDCSGESNDGWISFVEKDRQVVVAQASGGQGQELLAEEPSQGAGETQGEDLVIEENPREAGTALEIRSYFQKEEAREEAGESSEGSAD